MQFSLRTLFLLFVVIWSSMAAFGVWGILVAVVLGFVSCLFSRKNNRIAFIVGLGIVWFVGCLGVHSHRDAGLMSLCQNNLKHIKNALHNYHQDHGRFPPAYTTDAKGRPMHSWRVLLWPYLDSGDEYQKYRFDEPWNSPNNKKLAVYAPCCYKCLAPSAADNVSHIFTNYVAVTGPGTAWPGPEGSKLEDFHDDTSKTVLLVEISDSDINWMEPRDVTLEEALAGKPYEVPSSHHCVGRTYFFSSTYPLIGGNVLAVDGSVGITGFRLSRDQLAAVLSIDGGEKLEPDEVNYPDYGDSFLPGIDEARLLGFFIFVISMTMLVSRPIFGQLLHNQVDKPVAGVDEKKME